TRDAERTDAQLKNQQAALEKLLYRQYVAGRPETLAILLSGRNPNVTARQLHYLTYVARSRSELIARLSENVGQLQQLAEEAQKHAVELAAITAEQGEQRKRLEHEKRSRTQVLARIGRDMDQQRRKIGTMKRD